MPKPHGSTCRFYIASVSHHLTNRHKSKARERHAFARSFGPGSPSVSAVGWFGSRCRLPRQRRFSVQRTTTTAFSAQPRQPQAPPQQPPKHSTLRSSLSSPLPLSSDKRYSRHTTCICDPCLSLRATLYNTVQTTTTSSVTRSITANSTANSTATPLQRPQTIHSNPFHSITLLCCSIGINVSMMQDEILDSDGRPHPFRKWVDFLPFNHHTLKPRVSLDHTAQDSFFTNSTQEDYTDDVMDWNNDDDDDDPAVPVHYCVNVYYQHDPTTTSTASGAGGALTTADADSDLAAMEESLPDCTHMLLQSLECDFHQHNDHDDEDVYHDRDEYYTTGGNDDHHVHHPSTLVLEDGTTTENGILQHDLLFLADDLELNHHHHHHDHHHHDLHDYHHHHQHVSSTSDNEDSHDAAEAAPVADFEQTLAHLLTERRSKLAAVMTKSAASRAVLTKHIQQRASLVTVLKDIERSSQQVESAILTVSNDADAANAAEEEENSDGVGGGSCGGGAVPTTSHTTEDEDSRMC